LRKVANKQTDKQTVKQQRKHNLLSRGNNTAKLLGQTYWNICPSSYTVKMPITVVIWGASVTLRRARLYWDGWRHSRIFRLR